jgi:hypothetical protein
VGAVYQVVKAAVERDAEILKITNPGLLRSVRKARKSHIKEKSQETITSKLEIS